MFFFVVEVERSCRLASSSRRRRLFRNRTPSRVLSPLLHVLLDTLIETRFDVLRQSEHRDRVKRTRTGPRARVTFSISTVEKQPTFFFFFFFAFFRHSLDNRRFAPLYLSRRLSSASSHFLTCLAARRAPTALACCAPGADLRACERMVALRKRGVSKKKKRKEEKSSGRCGSKPAESFLTFFRSLAWGRRRRRISLSSSSRKTALSLSTLCAFLFLSLDLSPLFFTLCTGTNANVHNALYSRGEHRREVA